MTSAAMRQQIGGLACGMQATLADRSRSTVAARPRRPSGALSDRTRRGRGLGLIAIAGRRAHGQPEREDRRGSPVGPRALAYLALAVNLRRHAIAMAKDRDGVIALLGAKFLSSKGLGGREIGPAVDDTSAADAVVTDCSGESGHLIRASLPCLAGADPRASCPKFRTHEAACQHPSEDIFAAGFLSFLPGHTIRAAYRRIVK